MTSTNSTKTTLVDFSWPVGDAKTVQISGDWNDWATKEDLEIKQDGGFHKLIPLPENSKVLYKFIVDGNWTTKDSLPTETDSNNNVNNVVHVGPATTPELKRDEPAAAVKQAADEDIRNKIPEQVSNTTHSAAPALAGIGSAMGAAIASVTGVDPSLGSPTAVESKGVSDAASTTRNLPSHAELSETAINKSPALAGSTAITGAAFSAQSAVAPGTTSTEPIPTKDLSTTQLPSSLNPSSTEVGATSAKLGSPVSDSTQPSSSSKIPTEDEIKKAMSTPAAAAAVTSASAIPSDKKESTPVAASQPSSAQTNAATKEIPSTSTSQSTPLAAAKQSNSTQIPQAAAQSTTAQPIAAQPIASQPTVPAKDDLSQSKNAKSLVAPSDDVIVPAASASKSKFTSTTNNNSATESSKALPTTPNTPEKSKIKDGSQTVKEKRGSKFGTLGSSSKRKSNNDLASFVKADQRRFSQDVASGKPLNGVNENGNGNGIAEPTTPKQNRDRKVSLFGKIKHALSPHSSPSK